MKNLLRSLSVAALFSVALSSCSKKDSPAPGSFTYDSKTYSLSNAQYTSSGSYSELVMASGDVTSSSSVINAVSIMFDNSALTEGTYTYKPDVDQTFDVAKNFFDASAFINFKVSDGSGTEVDSITEGTVTVTKNGSSYSITYSLTFGDKTLTGKFNGGVQVVTP